MLAGHLEDAQVLAEQALDSPVPTRTRGNEAYALRLLGEIAVHRHPSERTQAEAHYRQALALADELGMRPLRRPLPLRPRHTVCHRQDSGSRPVPSSPRPLRCTGPWT